MHLTLLYSMPTQIMKQIFLLVFVLLTSGWANAHDTFESNTGKLTVPKVMFEGKIYYDVEVGVDYVHAILGGQPLYEYDIYTSDANQLFIPSVNVGNNNYTNVVIRIGQLFKVGGHLDAGPSDPCMVSSVSKANLNLPSDYFGNFLQTDRVRRLPTNIQRAMNIQDVDVAWLKPAASGCKDKNKYKINNLVETLNRLKDLGVEKVWIYNYSYIEDITKDEFVFSETEAVLPNSVLDEVVVEAHKRGIKVFYAFQLAFLCDLQGRCIDMNKLDTNILNKLMNAAKNKIVKDAKHGSEIGLDGIKVVIDAFSIKSLSTYNSDLRKSYVNLAVNTINEIKKVFSGKLVYGQSNAIYDPTIISLVDSMAYTIWTGQSYNLSLFNSNVADDAMKTYLSYIHYWLTQDLGDLAATKPIDWEIYSESNSLFYTSTEEWYDKFCTITMIRNNNCKSKSITTDLSLQSIFIDAAINSIVNQDKLKSNSISIYGYSSNDDVKPTYLGGAINYPNLGNSTRNKSAESIIKQWYIGK